MNRSQITDELKSAKDGVAATAQHLNEEAVKVTKSAVKGAQQKLEDLNAEAKDLLKGVEKNIKARPGESLALAFAAGVIVSLLLARR